MIIQNYLLQRARFIYIDNSELSTAKSCMNYFRWGWVYCYFMQIFTFQNIKSKIFSLFFQFSWYRLKNRFFVTRSLSSLGLSILVYLPTVTLRFRYIDNSKLSTAKRCRNCFRRGGVPCHFTQIFNFGNIKSKILSLLPSHCHLKVDLHRYINSQLQFTFMGIPQFDI